MQESFDFGPCRNILIAMEPQLTASQRETLTVLTPPWRTEFDELAAHLEYDCGLSRGRAEVRAYHCIADRLDPVPLV
jgi:hypothetical protein